MTDATAGAERRPEPAAEQPAPADRGRVRWLLGSLALQNPGRRKARTLLLVVAVAVGRRHGVHERRPDAQPRAEHGGGLHPARRGPPGRSGGHADQYHRGAADRGTDRPDPGHPLARPTGQSDGRAAGRAPRIFRTEDSGYGHHREAVDLIAFDPERDFTVQPWLEERLDRPLQAGDVIVGGRREHALGSELLLFGKPFRVYGKPGKTAVGTHERALFMSFETMRDLAQVEGAAGTRVALDPAAISGALVELAPGATAPQVRFAVLANLPGVKVVAGESMLTSVRQGLAALLNGILALMIIMFLSTALMVSVLFSAIITERRHELGLFKAIGARRIQIVGMMLTEAGVATAVGGLAGVVLGVLLLRFYERSLVYYLGSIGVPFVWLDTATVSCSLAAASFWHR